MVLMIFFGLVLCFLGLFIIGKSFFVNYELVNLKIILPIIIIILSLIIWSNKLFEGAKRIQSELLMEIAHENGGSISMNENVIDATRDADVIYTDVWVSMGEPDEVWNERINLLKDYQVNMDVMNNARGDAIFLHCLPSFHDLNTTIGKDIYNKFGLKEMEVTDEVFNSAKSKVFDQAENRLHTIKAVVYATMREDNE